MPKKTKLAGDFKLSIDQKELRKLILKIKQNYAMVGKSRVGPFKCENYYKKTLRRSVYYSENMQKFTTVRKNHFNLLRPFIKKGLKIEELKNFFNSKLKKTVKKNQLVEKTILQSEKFKMHY